MKIVLVHGQQHKGVTYTMTQKVLDYITEEKEIKEFFLPKDGPAFCVGCNSCFMKGEEYCPEAQKVQPIAKALEWADVIFLDSPNYVLEMSGSMKNLMDHLAYRWVTHRPSEKMFSKIGVTLCSSAGAPAGHTAKSLAKQLRWLCVSKVYRFPFVSNALNKDDIKPKKMAQLEKGAKITALKIMKGVKKPHVSLRTKFFFGMMGKMQSSPDAAWNPTDMNWWKEKGWINGKKPWK